MSDRYGQVKVAIGQAAAFYLLVLARGLLGMSGVVGGLYTHPTVGGTAEPLLQPYRQIGRDLLPSRAEISQVIRIHLKVPGPVLDRQVKRFQPQAQNSFSWMRRMVHRHHKAARSIRLMLIRSRISSSRAAS